MVYADDYELVDLAIADGRPAACVLAGFYVRFGSELDRGVNERVHDLSGRVLETSIPGVTDVIPGYASLYIEYDALRTDEARVRQALTDSRGTGWGRTEPAVLATGESREGAGPLFTHSPPEAGVRRPHQEVEVPVVYDGEDLDELAGRCGLEPEEVARIHSSTRYRVYALGFMPGFPFMGEVPGAIRQGRRSEPRASVPAHSVAIAGAQTGIYPLPSPGGWQLLGRALVSAYDPAREQPFLLEPGDTVRFVPRARGGSPPQPQAHRLLALEPKLPRLLVREPGLNDIVVDLGRFMAGRFGLARSGPLDAPAALLANRLVGNGPNEPLIEMSLSGPVLEVLGRCVVAFTGGGTTPLLNGEAVADHQSLGLEAGDVLTFKPGERGARGYLSLAGGFEAAGFLGSASTDLRGLVGSRLRAGDVLGASRPAAVRPGFGFRPFRGPSNGPVRLRLLPGPQATGEALAALGRQEFTVAAADRTGVRFMGGEVPGGEVLSEAVPLGAIQVPPGGSPILLLNDRGTMGGYRKPALLHPGDLPFAAQLRTGDQVQFVVPKEYP